MSDLVMRETATILSEEVRDPRIRKVTITGVRVNADFSLAEVLYTVPGKEKQHKDAQAALDKAAGFVRTKLVKRLDMKRVPQLRFVLDDFVEDMIYDGPSSSHS
jgi:ribosome-binding factor A